MVFSVLLSQLKLVFGALVILLVWHTLKQLFRFLCVKVVDFTSSPVNNYHEFFFVGFWGMKKFPVFFRGQFQFLRKFVGWRIWVRSEVCFNTAVVFGKVSKMVEVKFSFSNGNNCWKRKLPLQNQTYLKPMSILFLNYARLFFVYVVLETIYFSAMLPNP